ncbi:MAG: hypothetical protein AAGD96_21780, partial [Chloroflexota bacterium]
DMTIYYEGELPPMAEFDRIRVENGGGERKWMIGDHSTGSFAAAYDVNGIEVQIGHTTIAELQKQFAVVLVQHETDTPLHKALEGTLNSIALYGESYLEGWKEQARHYPDELAEAMVRKNLQFFPVWGLLPHFETRDSNLWFNQILVEASQRMIGALAGLNRLYFTTFQFKRMGYFINQMAHKPENFAERIDGLFKSDLQTAAFELEKLVQETFEMIEVHMPQIDTSMAKRRIGWRIQPWDPQE